MYNRLFTKILDSSIWLEPLTTRIVWITLIASMDADSYCHFSAIENLARRAGVTVDEAGTAIEALSSPDPNSSDPANDGRRIERVPGGFMILNGPKYRAIFNKQIEREQTRLRVKRFRERPSVTEGTVTGPLQPVTVALPNVTTRPTAPTEASASASASTEAEAEAKKAKAPASPSIEECRLLAVKIGIPETEADKFYHYYESVGWFVGKKKMKNPASAMAGWRTRWQERNQQNANTSQTNQRNNTGRPETGLQERQRFLTGQGDASYARALRAKGQHEAADIYERKNGLAKEVAGPGCDPSGNPNDG